MVATKYLKILLFISICMLFNACSSENTPVAEVFLGDWEIYRKNANNTGLVESTGEMNIDFGTGAITFVLTINDGDEPESLTGIVYNNYLYADTTHELRLGTLELTNNNILYITITTAENESVVYDARNKGVGSKLSILTTD